MRIEWGRWLLLAVLWHQLASCAVIPPVDADRPVLSAVHLLPGWNEDRHELALQTFIRSCPPLLADRRTARLWEGVCAAAARVDPDQQTAARRFFEDHFEVYSAGGDGLLTGYVQVGLQGRLQRDETFRYPVYRPPDDLVTVRLADFPGAGSADRQLRGRLADHRLVPYHRRADIARGILANRGLELLWLANPVDVYNLHVQGSGRVVLADGTVIGVGYAADNGWSYVPLAEVMAASADGDRPAGLHWDALKRWASAEPERFVRVTAANHRYIFFRRMADLEARGAMGVDLTPGRSLAVDRRYIPLGAPVWLASRAYGPGQRLTVAQDVGNAIRGRGRADFFHGFGPEAESRAGRTHDPRARLHVLLPRGVTLARASAAARR